MYKLLFLLKNTFRFGIGYAIDLFKYRKGKQRTLKMSKSKERYYNHLQKDKYPKCLGEWYRVRTGKQLNLISPTLFNEKLQWLKLYDATQRKSDLSDKYLAPKIVKDICKDDINIIPQIGVWDNANDINFDELPSRFVLKCNHGSGMNIIVKDKSKINITETRKQLNEWLKIDFSHLHDDFEIHYSAINRKIIAEKYIEEVDGNLHDYKIHCFNGKPVYIQLIGDRNPITHNFNQAFYDTNWKKMNITDNNHPIYEGEFEKPKKLDVLLRCAELLSKAFYYVRADFYIINDDIYFGELTFTPAGGLLKFSPESIDVEWGKLLVIPPDMNRDRILSNNK